MKVRITSKACKDMGDSSYDLSIPGHFVGFIKTLTDALDRKKDFEIWELTESEIYCHNIE